MESSCIYCGLGCRLNYEVKNNKILKITGVKNDDISDGVPCVKGLTIHEVYDKNRIKTPLINKRGKQIKVSLDEALNFIYANTKNLSPNDIFFNTSGKLTNENNYVMQKFQVLKLVLQIYLLNLERLKVENIVLILEQLVALLLFFKHVY